MTSARDITLRQPIVICPLDQQACKEEMDAIEQAATEASQVDPNSTIPGRNIVYSTERDALRHLGVCEVAGVKKLLIE
jgi:hypothetical protein